VLPHSLKRGFFAERRQWDTELITQVEPDGLGNFIVEAACVIFLEHGTGMSQALLCYLVGVAIALLCGIDYQLVFATAVKAYACQQQQRQGVHAPIQRRENDWSRRGNQELIVDVPADCRSRDRRCYRLPRLHL
jgi:hypothetical protein